MKYLFILFFALTSNLSFASYHGGDTTNPAYDEGGGGYSSGGSAAAAIIGLGVLEGITCSTITQMKKSKNSQMSKL